MDRIEDHPSYARFFDYRVDIHRRRNRVTASLDGVELARTERALLVDEQDHGLVFYFPRADVRLDLLAAVPDLSTICPWKGRASYWRKTDGADPIAWAYEDPKPEVAQIRDHIAFYQNKVTVAVGVAPYLAAAASSQKR
jgi:uncharacterized protein (DUF427 family)